jgi:hypothetical protein
MAANQYASTLIFKGTMTPCRLRFSLREDYVKDDIVALQTKRQSVKTSPVVALQSIAFFDFP